MYPNPSCGRSRKSQENDPAANRSIAGVWRRIHGNRPVRSARIPGVSIGRSVLYDGNGDHVHNRSDRQVLPRRCTGVAKPVIYPMCTVFFVGLLLSDPDDLTGITVAGSSPAERNEVTPQTKRSYATNRTRNRVLVAGKFQG